jgi:hypothetical protein
MRKDLKQYIDMHIKCIEMNHIKTPGGGYSSLCDFVNKHGKEYTYIQKPDSVPIGIAKLCFMNAYMLASQNEKYRYVEGYGIIEDIGLPIWHAWVIDEFDQVIDNTWTDSGSYYYGVVLNLDYAEYIISISGYYGIIDNMDVQFPLLKGKHKYLGDGKVEYNKEL